MDTRAFLTALWPASGIYCVARPFQTADMARPLYEHRTFNSIGDVVYAVDRMPNTNLFFCVHTLKEHRVWNPNKKDPKTGNMGAFERRTQSNMKEARCFFFDLDVGEGAGKYTTQHEALNGLESFLFATRLPEPVITSSGGGYHVYWRVSNPIPSDDWAVRAAKLYHLARRYGLRVDPSRTTDTASVLRIVGTVNQKPGKAPRPCVALQAGVETPTPEFLNRLDDLVGPDVIVPARRAARPPVTQGNLDKGWDGPVRTIDEVAEVCEHVRDYLDEGYGEGGYVRFYHLGCGLIPFVEDGDEIALEQARRHPRYTEGYYETEREKYVVGTGGNPASCAKLDAVCGGDACARCPNKGLGVNPLTVATAVLRQAPAPAPKLEPEIAAEVGPVVIVEPPFPYSRTASGIYQEVTKQVKEEEITEKVLICPYDMFPYAACSRTELEPAFSLWAVTIPLAGQRKIKIPFAIIQDSRALHALLSDHEIHINAKQLGKVQDLMHAWFLSVQKQTMSSQQFDHLGWVDEKREGFILPDKLIRPDGGSRPCQLSPMAKSSAAFVGVAGDKERHVELLRFYDRPEYIKHQFLALCGLAAPLFYATGHAGVVVNANGPSGGSKSTALYTAASFWGRPKRYTINGTKQGATTTARNEIAHTLANLPVCVDEITLMEPRDAQEFVMGATQEGAKVRSNRSGRVRESRGGVKSTIMLTSSNKSLHSLLSVDNPAGSAGNMRVFEIDFARLETDKALGDEYLNDLEQNYGHIGPAFIERFMPRRDEIEQAIRKMEGRLAREFGIAPPERFWSAVISSALVAGRFAREYGLIPYDIDVIQAWVINEQLAAMRKTVNDEEAEAKPEALLAAFLADVAGHTIVTLQSRDGGAFSQIEPRGALMVHRDMSTRIAHVRKDAFRDWCGRRQRSSIALLRDLERCGFIFDVGRKRTLGHGTPHATGRTICFSVDMANKAFAGEDAPAKVVPLRPEKPVLTEVTA